MAQCSSEGLGRQGRVARVVLRFVLRSATRFELVSGALRCDSVLPILSSSALNRWG